MTFYEAKLQGTLTPLKVLTKCFSSLDTIMQPRSKQNRSKYNADGTTQEDHTEEAMGQRLEDFNNG